MRQVLRKISREIREYGFPRVCQCCKAQGAKFPRNISFTVKKRRTNSAYADDELNYATCCVSCMMEICEYYQELWDSYYS